MTEPKPRVFGIGLSRTATRSLAFALERLGWRTIHYPRTVLEIHAYEAAVDVPVSRRFRYLDLAYPGAKFILTVRDLDRWLESCRRHFGSQTWRNKPFAEWTASECDTADNDFAVYRVVTFDPERFTAAYRKHEQRVRAHFAGRDNLLILDIEQTDDAELWRHLACFINAEVPDEPFPWENKGG